MSHIDIDLPRRFSRDLDHDGSACDSKSAATHVLELGRKGHAMLKRAALIPTVLTLAAVIGCHERATRVPNPKAEPTLKEQSLPQSQGEKLAFASAQPAKSLSGALRDERLKRLELADHTIAGDNYYRGVTGIWVPESKDPAKALVFPEQVQITCTSPDKTCRELTVPLGVLGDMVEIMDIEEKAWQLVSWDEHGLLASYGQNTSRTAAASERCHRHVLTMTFSSGAVSTSDIPTHEKGCEEFQETDSYRLVRGNYYVDTSPANDMDKRK
jgi:hypothetical protein